MRAEQSLKRSEPVSGSGKQFLCLVTISSRRRFVAKTLNFLAQRERL